MNELKFTKTRYLAEFERGTYLKEILRELSTPKSSTTDPYKKDLNKDLNRKEFEIKKGVSPADIVNMSKFYAQNLIYTASGILPMSSKQQISMDCSHGGIIFKVGNKIYVEHTVTDPILTFFQPNGQTYQKTIPGTVKTRFSFDEQRGFDLVSVEFSNKTLHDIIKSPLKLKKGALKPALPSNHKIDTLADAATKSDAREPGKRVVTLKYLDKLSNYLESDKQQSLQQLLTQDPKKLTNIVQLLSDGAIEVDESATHISTILVEEKSNGEKVYRTTLRDPFFNITDFSQDTESTFGGAIPGEVSIDYTLDTQGKYRVEQMKFTNATLQRFVLNPPHLLVAEKSEQRKLFLSKPEFTHLQNQAYAQEENQELPNAFQESRQTALRSFLSRHQPK